MRSEICFSLTSLMPMISVNIHTRSKIEEECFYKVLGTIYSSQDFSKFSFAGEIRFPTEGLKLRDVMSDDHDTSAGNFVYLLEKF
jgi:hypothetical protein